MLVNPIILYNLYQKDQSNMNYNNSDWDTIEQVYLDDGLGLKPGEIK